METRWSIVCRCVAALLVAAGTLSALGAPKGKTSVSVLKVKPGNYSPRGKLTRREFVEKTFGVKFGEKIDKYFTPGESSGSAVAAVPRKLSAPVCGLKDARLISIDGKLIGIDFGAAQASKRESGTKSIKARLDKFSQSVGKWLGIKSFEPNDFAIGESEGEKVWCLTRAFDEDDLAVSVTMEYTEQGKTVMGGGCILLIRFHDEETREPTDLEMASLYNNGRTGTQPPQLDPKEEKVRAERVAQENKDAEKAKTVEETMKRIIIPNLCLKPPATIIDAVEVLSKMSRDYDDPTLPVERRGVFLFLKNNPNNAAPTVQELDETNISLWDALDKVCAGCGWKFGINGSIVCIVPKGEAASQLITRGIKFSERTVDAKAGTAGVKDSFKKRDMLKAWLEQQGVDWPSGSSFMYISGYNMLRVKNTKDNLDKIEKLLSK